MLLIKSENLPLSEEFPYLGQTIAYNNSDWAAVYLNLRKARRWWGMIVRVLERTIEMMWDRGAMKNAVAQLVLLYGSAIWVVTREMLKVLTVFHHQAARQIMGMTAKRGAGGEWEYPVVDEAMDAVGIHPIRVYIKRRQTNISERVACFPVYALCTEVKRIPGTIRIVC